MSKLKLVPPCSYQGGKQRLSKKIVDIIFEQNEITENTKFYDLCCGSGAISLEMVNRGFHPSNIIMVDSGCFGQVWNSIANDEFNLELFKQEVNKLPDKSGCKTYLETIANSEIDTELEIYHYLLLQSGSFGGKALWTESNKWKHHGFRDYWMPTATSVRRSPCNPMQPNPNEMYNRAEILVENLGGIINAIHGDINDFVDNSDMEENCIIYIDPPYKNTTGYKNDINILSVVKKLRDKSPSASIYVSEGEKISDIAIDVSNGKKGNITGNMKKKQVGEWLNIIK